MLCAKFDCFKKFSIMYIYYLAIFSTLRRAWQVRLKMAQWFCRRGFIKVLNVFLLFPNYLPFEKGVALHLNKIEFPSPKDALCQVWLKLVQCFWRRRFLKVLFPQLSPLWEGFGPSFEQTLIPFTRGYFVPNLVKIGPLVLEKKILKIYFYYFTIISPLGRTWPFIWTNLNSLHPRMLCAKFGSGEEDENVKSLQTDGRTDRRRTTGDQKSPLERSAQVS